MNNVNFLTENTTRRRPEVCFQSLNLAVRGFPGKPLEIVLLCRLILCRRLNNTLINCQALATSCPVLRYVILVACLENGSTMYNEMPS